MEAEALAIEKKPRRNVMTSIRRRLNSGAYNKTRNLKRNERNVREKLRSFEKKGELKGYMLKRYDDARNLLAKLEVIKEVGADVLPVIEQEQEQEPRKKFTVRRRLKNALNYGAAANAAVPTATAAAAANAAVPTAAAPTYPPFTLKKRYKKLEAPYVAPEFVAPPANLPPVPIPQGEYNREGEFHVTGYANSNSANNGAELNAKRFGYIPKEKTRKVAKPKFYAFSRKELANENIPYLERVHAQFLPLPELYNPYTGVKYGPEEDPLKNIESAHLMLEEILEKAKKKAMALKRKEARKTQARAAV